MKTKLVFVGLAIGLLLLSSCDYQHVRASREVTTRNIDLTEYSGIRVSDDFNVHIDFSSGTEGIEIEASQNLQDKIVVHKEGDILVIRLENHLSIHGKITLNAYVSAEILNSFEVKGDSQIHLDSPLEVSDATISVSGDSDFTGEVNVQNLKIEARGNSRLDIYGSAQQVNVKLRGDSELLDYDLDIRDLVIDMRGSSKALLTVRNTIDIEARGASVLRYVGDADITHEHLSGNSKLVRTN